MADTSLHTKPSQSLALLGLLGFGISIYALALHVKQDASGAALECDLNNLVNCSKVLGGDYGSFLGIPLGGYGMAYFAILMATALMPMYTRASKAWHLRMQLGVAGVGAAVSLGLALLSALVIQSVCLVCSAVHVTALVAFVLALVGMVRNPDKALHTEGNPLMKWLSACLAVAVPALLAGAITPIIAPQIMKGSGKAPELDMTKEAAPESVLSVSRSRYVGKGEDFRKGNDEAKVVVQMFSDFQCPHCKIAADSIEQAIQKVGADKVLFVYRNYPLDGSCNPSMGGTGRKSCLLAETARCAGQQGKFWEMKAWAFGLMSGDPQSIDAATASDALAKQATALGLDNGSFQACLASDVELEKIRDDVAVANKLGIKGTPMLFINNRHYEGSRAADDLALLFKSLSDGAP
jgi:protein-disulfide isomerase